MIEDLWSDKFEEKFGQIVKANIGEINGLNKAKVVVYTWGSDNWGDIRKVFNQTTEEDNALIEYYQPHWDSGDTRWESIMNVAKAVNSRILYKDDYTNWGKAEYWARPIDTHNKMTDDCDGYAVLITKVLRLMGLEDWEVFTAVGPVKHPYGTNEGEYHAYVLVFDFDTFLFYPLEGSWYPGLALNDFKNKRPYLDHMVKTTGRYLPADWLTNDSVSYANTPWFWRLKAVR